jgi:hypothetical protein
MAVRRDGQPRGYTTCIRETILVDVKDAGIRIRVEKSLRTSFSAACQAENKQASDVLREFMEVYVAQRRGGQGDLFSERREEVRPHPADSGAPST